jgi:hypothetical protein
VIAPPIIGYIHQNTPIEEEQGYEMVEIFFIGVSILAFLFNLGVYFYDLRNRNNILQSVQPIEAFENYTQKIKIVENVYYGRQRRNSI